MHVSGRCAGAAGVDRADAERVGEASGEPRHGMRGGARPAVGDVDPVAARRTGRVVAVLVGGDGAVEGVIPGEIHAGAVPCGGEAGGRARRVGGRGGCGLRPLAASHGVHRSYPEGVGGAVGEAGYGERCGCSVAARHGSPIAGGPVDLLLILVADDGGVAGVIPAQGDLGIAGGRREAGGPGGLGRRRRRGDGGRGCAGAYGVNGSDGEGVGDAVGEPLDDE